MVTQPSDDFYDQVQETWPEERPSRKRVKRAYRRSNNRRVVVRGERLPEPDTARMSRALLAAQRALAQVQAERDARAQEHDDE